MYVHCMAAEVSKMSYLWPKQHQTINNLLLLLYSFTVSSAEGLTAFNSVLHWLGSY